ncbi:MAG: ribonuclease J [bacterium]|jgi:ribonuclease J
MTESESFLLTLLGGVGEIGKNCVSLEVDDDLFIIDCGLSFPDVSAFGVDIIIPDFTYLYKNQHRIKGLFLTHGHEDHIGAIPYLIEGLDEPLPIYGTKLTLGLVKNKISEWNQLDKVEYRELVPGETVSANGTSVTGYRVTHSIPDAVSLAFRTPYGTLLHSGDFKIDPSPVDGRLTDKDGLAELGREGVSLLMCDITNVERLGRTISESAVGPSLEAVFKSAGGRVFTTTFASNIHRIQQIINAAHHLGRKVAIVGRSMIKNVAMAQEIGYLKVPSGTIIDIDDIRNYQPEQIVIIVTGSQGEPMAALTQISQDRHARVAIEKGDMVIFSASPIPGNETAIYGVINDLFRLGADVIYGPEYGVHASGHGSEEDIKEYIGLVQPTYILPHHGQYRHLRKFVSLAGTMGFDEDRIILSELGDQWEFSQSGFKLAGKTRSGVVYISGDNSAEVASRTIQERRELARDGTIYISVVLSADGKRRLSDVIVEHKGFIPESKDPAIYEKIREAVLLGIANNRLRSREYRLQLQNNVGQSVQAVVQAASGLRPNVQMLVNYADRDEKINGKP